jgi:hypothetical protein
LDDGRPPLCGQLFKKSKSYPTKYENLALEQGTNSFSRLSIQVGDEAPIILYLQLGFKSSYDSRKVFPLWTSN